MNEQKGSLNADGLNFGIVVSRFNERVTKILLDGALDCLDRHKATSVDVRYVPGTFEVPHAAKVMASGKGVDAVICLGAVIRGETPHFEFVASQAAKGIASLGISLDKPVIYGVITADSTEQALERAGVKQGNRGWDAALAAIEMANLSRGS
ncbi:6,7-dimethyl-8-ribityllumazine synthase [candidate division WOR-3 bacterium]|uniref:6,7-dimethyl-8-ribityllumazine synthase n=1 Tax=candidate division WOR-3 bacterium TaxID=2052148 RepID=A0A9D5K9Q4_UNCW3|nr:6,7-dimethyl-8-ribityllumazine synthase [candidate division WOR-3 bacterium]MBD3364745.1 6,7-dimethyl-8-ribityllumazine synthase [candidate division WOR-3 bacterium]